MRKSIKTGLMNASFIVPAIFLVSMFLMSKKKFDNIEAYGYNRLSMILISLFAYITLIVLLHKWLNRKGKAIAPRK